MHIQIVKTWQDVKHLESVLKIRYRERKWKGFWIGRSGRSSNQSVDSSDGGSNHMARKGSSKERDVSKSPREWLKHPSKLRMHMSFVHGKRRWVKCHAELQFRSQGGSTLSRRITVRSAMHRTRRTLARGRLRSGRGGITDHGNKERKNNSKAVERKPDV